MNKKLREVKGAIIVIKLTAVLGIVTAVICIGGAIWVWSSALTAEATSHQSVYPAESMRDVLLGAGLFLLTVAGISLGSVGKISKVLQGTRTDADDE